MKRTHCELCCRSSQDISKHHLIPAACHTNKWFKKNFTRHEMGHRAVFVCRECHHAIHDAVPSEKELGKKWNTKELLLSHPKIRIHVEWMQKRYKIGQHAKEAQTVVAKG